MTKISKRTREQAAHICAIAASSTRYATYIHDVLDWQGKYWDFSAQLAYHAITYVERRASHHPAGPNKGWDRGNVAEAESLLRTGWSPTRTGGRR